jgi:hypothetical protein
MPDKIKTPTPSHPLEVQRRMLRMVVDRYLTSQQPTTREDLVIDFRSPSALDELTSRGILRAVRNSSYLPTAVAFHHCGDQHVEELAKHAIQTIAQVFEAQLLAKRHDFSREALLADAKIFDPAANAKMIELALFLAPEFPLISTWKGGHDEEPIITPVKIDERLAEPTNLKTLWDDCIRKKDPWADQQSLSETTTLSSSLQTDSRELAPSVGGNKWSRDQKLSLIGVIVAILSIAATIAFPEVRVFLHLQTPDPNVKQEPSIPSFEPPDLESRKWSANIRASDFPSFEGTILFGADTYAALGDFLVPLDVNGQHLECPAGPRAKWEYASDTHKVITMVMTVGSYASGPEYRQCVEAIRPIAAKMTPETCTFINSHLCRGVGFELDLH